MTLAAVELLPFVMSFLAGVAIPNVVDFVTHSSAPWWVKSFIATVLAALAGAVTTTIWQDGDTWQIYLLNIIAAFTATFSAHHAGTSQVVERVTADFGLFKKPQPALDSTLPPPTAPNWVSPVDETPSGRGALDTE